MRRWPNARTALVRSHRSFCHRLGFAAMLRQVDVDELAQPRRLDETPLPP
jgi:hypothetical protein